MQSTAFGLIDETGAINRLSADMRKYLQSAFYVCGVCFVDGEKLSNRHEINSNTYDCSSCSTRSWSALSSHRVATLFFHCWYTFFKFKTKQNIILICCKSNGNKHTMQDRTNDMNRHISWTSVMNVFPDQEWILRFTGGLANQAVTWQIVCLLAVVEHKFLRGHQR